MPKITPPELISYTTFPEVKSRDTTLLADDITEAESEIERRVGHNFSDTTKYPTLPEPVKIAYLKLAQWFALVNQDENMVKGVTSEKIGNYSVTLPSGKEISYPNVDHLIAPYIEETGTIGNTTIRMGLF